MEEIITSDSAEQTMALGRTLGGRLRGGEVLAIVGPLGSGKTHLIKGIAEGAGAPDAREVNSPTFVLVNEYAGRLDLYHIDAYRLDSVAEFEML
ncbi:MAG: tRNA (adenosine(37)-N6)-threonylcarbamoyltransferase complex ATPase subunit type 1 TsaE, partial [Planctomycetes bacterium]|nr:tRNA (adenosine(37)-N6)-threonylcarbamoyltransferase complex ATPase subunit type 1 TsaE [Planctomycetota bacterium]